MANYQFLDAQGNLVGPVSLETLRQMKQEGKLGGQTQVLDEAANRFTTLDQLLGGGGNVVFPAPPLKVKRYFFADLNNTPVGPFTLEELQQQLMAGKIRAETQVIEEGGTVWQTYSSIMMQRLSDSTGGASVPPPPPSSNPKEVSLDLVQKGLMAGTPTIGERCILAVGKNEVLRVAHIVCFASMLFYVNAVGPTALPHL